MVGGGVRQAHHHDASVGVDDLNVAAVQVGEDLSGHDFLWGSHPETPARQVQHPVHVVDDGVDLVGDKNHRAVLLMALLVDQRADGLLVVQVQGKQWLIAEQDFGIRGQRLGYPETLLLAAGELAHRNLGVVSRPHQLKEFINPAVGLGRRQAESPPVAVHPQAHQVPGAHGCVTGERFLLRDVADQAAAALNRVSAERGLAPVQVLKAQQDFEEACFAASVGSKHREELARPDLQVQILPQRPLAECEGRPGEADHGFHLFVSRTLLTLFTLSVIHCR
jgi:hypothetical protein